MPWRVLTASDDDEFTVRPGRAPAARQGLLKTSLRRRGIRTQARGGLRSRGARGAFVRSPGASAQRVLVKVKIARPGMTGSHVTYLGRDGAGRDGQRPQFFDQDSVGIAPHAFVDRVQEEDPHVFRVILSPEQGDQLDLVPFTRELMRTMAVDLDTPLTWIAIAHYNTDNPHVHLLVSGRDANGQALYIDRDYLSEGIRAQARIIATRALGPRLEHDRPRSLAPDHTPGLPEHLQHARPGKERRR